MTRSRLMYCLVLGPALALTLACNTAEPDGALRASGYVEATEMRVAAKVGGRVVTVAVAEGDRVTAGQVLVTLSTTDADLQVGRLEAERAQADAQLRLLLAGARREDVDQATAQVAVADAELKTAQADLDAAELDVIRFTRLVDQRAGTVKAKDDAEARRRAAAARVEAMRERVAAARMAVTRVSAGARREEVEAARARLAVVDAALATVRADISDATITAPSDGIVASRLIEPGELVARGVPLLVLLDLDRAWASAYVEAPQIGAIQLGQRATVITDAGVQLPGRVTAIASRAEFTPRNVQTADERARLVYRVTVSVDNRNGTLKPGMPVEVTW